MTTTPIKTYEVSTTGSDSNLGDKDSPFLTIGKAASVAMPGDTVIVRGGTYREWVRPARGGKGEDARITYRAAAGEKVCIKGSEQITSWVAQSPGVWRAEIPNELFGTYNPYGLNLTGEWLVFGNWRHRGDVYLDGKALSEVQTPGEVATTKNAWHAQVRERSSPVYRNPAQKSKGTTVIYANFGEADPNKALAEINVRPYVFFPNRTKLHYITVDGFHLMHSAENWQTPIYETQTGMIGPRGGKCWIIQNCQITDARCVGIVLGEAAGVDYSKIDAFGNHIVRNNIIRRCGQAGIYGIHGGTRCLIEGNLIEDINYREEIGGHDTAGIKFHFSVDTIIRGNLIRRVHWNIPIKLSHTACGIWMDNSNQGTRITGNIIYDIDYADIYLEMNHGPILVDNNVVIRSPTRIWRSMPQYSRGGLNIFAHNLFIDCDWGIGLTSYPPTVFAPHTRKVVKPALQPPLPHSYKWFNNIFVNRGLSAADFSTKHTQVIPEKEAGWYGSDNNVFLGGAKASTFGDEHSLVSAAAADVTREETPLGVTIEFSITPPLPAAGPWVDGKLVGVLPIVNQTIEDRYGVAIRVDTDMTGAKRTQAIPGPLAELRPGRNRIVWAVKS